MIQTLSPIKFRFSAIEHDYISSILNDMTRQTASLMSVPEKTDTSIAQELLPRFRTNEFSVRKKSYTKSLRYHEAHMLTQQLLAEQQQNEPDAYLASIRNNLLFKMTAEL